MQLYLLRYNNYYNRQIKREHTIDDYAQYCIPSGFPYAPASYTNPVVNVNFKPNDGVDTSIDINWYGTIPDYVVVGQEQQIVSRWFVLDAHRLRDGQYRLQLYRDTIADYWNDFRDAPAFIEKATVTDVTNPLLYNAENSSFNQIRKDIKYLADSSDCAWVVGYIPQDYEGGTVEIINNYTDFADTRNLIRVNQLTDFPYYDYFWFSDSPWVKKWAYNVNELTTELEMYYTMPYPPPSSPLAPVGDRYFKYYVGEESFRQTEVPSLNSISEDHFAAVRRLSSIAPEEAGKELYESIVNYGASTYKNAIKAYQDKQYGTVDIFSELQSYDNKVIVDESTGIYYKVNFSHSGDTPEVRELYSARGYDEFELLQAVIPALPKTGKWECLLDNALAVPQGYFKLVTTCKRANLKLTAITNYSKLRIEIPSIAERVHCKDQPFDIFCMPYSTGKKIWLSSDELTYITSSANVALTVGQGIALATGANAIYDVQLLPYCPVPTLLSNGGILGNVAATNIMSVIEDTQRLTVGKLWWVSSSEVTNTITLPEPLVAETRAINRKVKSETTFARIVAPNYSKFFDFNIQKNGGLDQVLVQMSLRPYNPWIKLTPYFNGNSLYSSPDIAHDARGLVLSGDFSLTQATDAWSTYELNNKNYLSIFDRQIQSMEINRDIARWEGGFQGAAGTLVGISGGAVAGGIIGGYFTGGAGTMAGAAIGAAAGGVGSALTGGADWYLRELKMNESIDYTKDQFAYQLGNIKALPQGLAKTTALNSLNTLVPTLELWGTTETEEQALYNKLKYNGMTIGIIDTIANWLTDEENYLKVRLIRCEQLDDDTHILNTISSELNKGVFIGEHTIYV